MSLELAVKIAEGNSLNQNLKGLRIKNKNIVATDLINTIKIKEALRDEKLDCYVDAKSYAAALKATNIPTMVQSASLLTVSEGKFKADLQLIDNAQFITDPDTDPTGKGYEPKNFCEVVKELTPFLNYKSNTGVRPQAYLYNGYMYVTGGEFLVRAKLETEFTENDPQKPLTIQASFADLLNKIKEPPVEVIVSDGYLAVTFESSWVMGSRYALPMPGDFATYFDIFEKTEMPPLEADVLQSLVHVVSFANDEDVITFGPMGISLMQMGKVSFSIACPMSPFVLKAKALKTIMDYSTHYGFPDPSKILFKGGLVEGTWANGMFATGKK